MKIVGKKITTEELAARVSTALQEHGIDALLVGKACVSIYTANQYISGDLDFVSFAAIKESGPVLRDVGTEQGAGTPWQSGCMTASAASRQSSAPPRWTEQQTKQQEVPR